MEFLEKYMTSPEVDVDLHTSKLKGQINIPIRKDLQYDFKQNSQDEM